MYKPTFNRQKRDKIEWCEWTWNPYTGCLNSCSYCYAREIAQSMDKKYYPYGFEPHFRPERLSAPDNTRIPEKDKGLPGIRNVFLVSMGDLFGTWVKKEWIDTILQAVKTSPQWTYLLLTKFPERLTEIEFPQNTWVGTTIDKQERVGPAEKAFSDVQASVKFISCEPFLEPLRFNNLKIFDWVIVGGKSKTSKLPAMYPSQKLIDSIYEQAKRANCKIYFKPNLFECQKENRLKEFPCNEDNRATERTETKQLTLFE